MPRDSLVPKAMATARAAADVAAVRKRGATRRHRRPQLDTLSRNRDLLFLIFQKVKDGLDEAHSSPSRSFYEFTSVHFPHSTVTSTTVKTITQSRVHDLVQDEFSKICRVNRAWAQVCLPLLWERPKIRTSRQLDRFAYTLEHHGLQYLGYIQELLIRQGSIPDPNSENLWWGHARCRAIIAKVVAESTRLRFLDCNWAGSPFDHGVIQAWNKDTMFSQLRALRMEPLRMPSKECWLSEADFNKLISCSPHLESLELEGGYHVCNRSIIHILITCEQLSHFVFPANSVSGFVDGLYMGYGDELKSIKVYGPPKGGASFDLMVDDYPFRSDSLSKLKTINLEMGCGEFVRALFTRPKLPSLRSLRILLPSNSILELLSQRLAPQLTFFETKLNDQTDPETYKMFSCKLTSLQSLDCSPGPVLGLIGRNITTLSANSSLRLLDTVAELCPNLEDLTLWGGSISRDPCNRTRADPQTGLIYVIEMCPIKRLRLVNAYLGLGPRFWQACGEFGKHLAILDIELLDLKGMNSWGMFEGLRYCKELQWLRLTELLGVQKEVMISCLVELKRLCALYLSIPDMETGCFSMSMEEIFAFVACFQELSEVNLVVPRPCPNSASTTPRSSIDMNQRRSSYGLPYARADPTMIFKNAYNQNIYGRVEWSVPGLGYY
ncbi:hypothetical protein BGZ92_002066 [Podila epicladia]|nr:hypothetical protein BGZ92_002066 [Podila epicladia]